jgi:hypothetical protein
MTTMAEQVRPRGRPPGHSGAKEREEAVLKLLEGKRVRYAGLHALWEQAAAAAPEYAPQEPSPGMTRNELAQELGESVTKVYLALDRLRKARRVRKCSGEGSTTVWTTGAGCP